MKPIVHGLFALLTIAASAAYAGPKDNSLNWAWDSMPANLLPYGNVVREEAVGAELLRLGRAHLSRSEDRRVPARASSPTA